MEQSSHPRKNDLEHVFVDVYNRARKTPLASPSPPLVNDVTLRSSQLRNPSRSCLRRLSTIITVLYASLLSKNGNYALNTLAKNPFGIIWEDESYLCPTTSPCGRAYPDSRPPSTPKTLPASVASSLLLKLWKLRTEIVTRCMLSPTKERS
jgi:hypothetical protein